jgi:LTXXQ motif family protein
MLLITHPAARRIAAATLFATIVFASPFLSVSGDLAHAAGKPKPAPADPVEARIKTLHSSLQITTAQEALWNNVAQVMRENAKAMADHRKEAAQNAKSRSAVDDLKAYAAAIDAHADGIHKFIPTFQALYDSMSDAQKQTADAVFLKRMKAAAERHKR